MTIPPIETTHASDGNPRRVASRRAAAVSAVSTAAAPAGGKSLNRVAPS